MLLAGQASEAREGQAALRAALSPFPAGKLPACWAVAGAAGVYSELIGGVSNAITEIEEVLTKTRKELAELLKSAAL